MKTLRIQNPITNATETRTTENNYTHVVFYASGRRTSFHYTIEKALDAARMAGDVVTTITGEVVRKVETSNPVEHRSAKVAKTETAPKARREPKPVEDWVTYETADWEAVDTDGTVRAFAKGTGRKREMPWFLAQFEWQGLTVRRIAR